MKHDMSHHCHRVVQGSIKDSCGIFARFAETLHVVGWCAFYDAVEGAMNGYEVPEPHLVGLCSLRSYSI
jgi:hypothetical protein